MRTWQDPGLVIASGKRTLVRNLLDRLLEGVARAEGGDLLGRDLHLLAGLGVSALPGLALLDGELPEAHDLDLLARFERLGHDLLEGREVPLGFAGWHIGHLGDPLDELLLLHGCPFLRSPSAYCRPYSCCLRSSLYGSGGPVPPPRYRQIWRSGRCWGALREMHPIWYGSILLVRANLADDRVPVYCRGPTHHDTPPAP